MQSAFGAGGFLAQALPAFEPRPGQAHMARRVEEALEGGGVILIEAGTGTGKSLAYLMPAAKKSLESNRPVVISTHTIHLQEQLLGKDIPLIQEGWAPELKAALAKGWGNYLCHLRLEQATNQASLLPDEGPSLDLRKIAKWAAEDSGDGSLQALPFQPSPEAWNLVNAEGDTCLRQSCPHYERCPVFRARRRLEEAHLIVVNHHLLMSDVAIRRESGFQLEEAILPAYGHLVIDEAHHLEDVAAVHLGVRLTGTGIAQLLGRLAPRSGGRGRGGLLNRLRWALSQLHGQVDEETLTDISARLEREVAERLSRAQAAADGLFQQAAAWLRERQGDDPTRSARFRPEDPWEADEAGEICAEALEELAKGIAGVARQLEAEWFAEDPGLPQEMEALGRRAARYGAACRLLTSERSADRVYWVEGDPLRPNRLQLCAAPLDVGAEIRSWVLAELESMVCCSATLCVDEDFSYIRERLGFGPGDLEADCVQIASPFDYRRQALLLVPDDLAEPGDPAFPHHLAAHLKELLLACRGRAFVLFTSHALLRTVREAVEPVLEEAGITLLVQGDRPRTHLLHDFKEDGASVLLGADSFWEGVDVPGDALSVVAITRLPFESPGDPLAEARAEWLAQQGKNPFASYSLPRAALKLKQGFGRLIRTAADRGGVVVYDRRLLTRAYGRALLAALPECSFASGPHSEMVQRLQAWLQSPTA